MKTKETNSGAHGGAVKKWKCIKCKVAFDTSEGAYWHWVEILARQGYGVACSHEATRV